MLTTKSIRPIKSRENLGNEWKLEFIKIKTMRMNHQEIIQTLKRGNFFIECPESNGIEVSLKQAVLFDNDNFTPDAVEIYQQQLNEIKERKQLLKQLKSTGTSKSQYGAHSVNIGSILERIAPAMSTFRFNHNDCRSLFDPIDYVIFEGLSNKGRVNKIFFVDIKTGKAPLKPRQKEIRNVVNDKKVIFKTY